MDYSDQQLINFLKQNNGRDYCGWFLETQLRRDLVPEKKKRSSSILLLQKMAAALLLAQSIAFNAAAQTKKHITRTAQAPIKIKSGKTTIYGRVVDATTKLPLPGLKVSSDDGVTAVTDALGQFALHLGTTIRDTVTISVPHGTTFNAKAPYYFLPVTVHLSHPGKVVLYRYEQQLLKEKEINAERIVYQKVIREGGIPLSDPYARKTKVILAHNAPKTSAKRSIWQRITNIFRHKKKSI